MTTHSSEPSKARRWAQFRLEVLGHLLASPPAKGELHQCLEALASKVWITPDGNPDTFGVSTLERWYYKVRHASDPVAVLLRSARSDRGRGKALSGVLLSALQTQYAQHPSWSYQLHCDNLVALCNAQPERYGAAPSYSTVRRQMQRRKWFRKKKDKEGQTEGQRRAHARRELRETRSFEVECAHALWHFDFHRGKRKVADKNGNWHVPMCLCILDDCSRLCCHVQWYIGEGAEELVHGLCQAMAKRGLPRSVIHDNGSAMKAAETVQGWRDLGIIQEPTLEYSPQQNGKQEVFWGQLEGRLMAMLESIEHLTLDYLNRATLAWAEVEYHNKLHDELGTTPLQRAARVVDVSRPSPGPVELGRAFTCKERRTQRRSDGTVSIKGVRFELPNRLRTLRRITVRYARWDLSQAWVVDPDTNVVVATLAPIDKAANADTRRRLITSPQPSQSPAVLPGENDDPVPPLLRHILQEYAATGLPPAFIPKD